MTGGARGRDFLEKEKGGGGWAGHGPKAGARGGGGGWAKMGKEGGRKRKGFSFFSKSIFLDDGFSHF
jgi:hypothetical protein